LLLRLANGQRRDELPPGRPTRYPQTSGSYGRLACDGLVADGVDEVSCSLLFSLCARQKRQSLPLIYRIVIRVEND
jgi:hypothetical protein